MKYNRHMALRLCCQRIEFQKEQKHALFSYSLMFFPQTSRSLRFVKGETTAPNRMHCILLGARPAHFQGFLHGTFLLGIDLDYPLLNLLPNVAKPTKPKPSSSMVAGSELGDRSAYDPI